MKLFPAIDLYGGQAVRLYKGNYEEMTVYSEDPVAVARTFEAAGCSFLHTVDLAAARDGAVHERELISRFVKETSLFVQVGGGIRSLPVIEEYLSLGVGRVVLGTAALTDESFLREALRKFGARIAVGVDIKDGCVAIRGWRETSAVPAEEFLARLESLGVDCVICTDVSRDGAMQGPNRELYRRINETYSINFIASGGVSSTEDLAALKAAGLYGAILGKAYYTGAVSLQDALEVCR